jgi:hypothetical protein
VSFVVRYLEDNVKALSVKLTIEEMNALTEAVPQDKVGRMEEGDGRTNSECGKRPGATLLLCNN